MDAVIRELRSSEIFSSMEESILRIIAAEAEHETFDAGDTLFRAGDPRDHFILVLEGNVEVVVESGDAAGTLVVLGAGDGVGEAGLLEPGFHTASGRAASDVAVLILPVAGVRERLADNGRAAMELFAAVSRVMVRRLQYASSRRIGWEEVYRPVSPGPSTTCWASARSPRTPATAFRPCAPWKTSPSPGSVSPIFRT
jgi:CRP/FNR family cyclic AMP-dependent transcriptional regulator